MTSHKEVTVPEVENGWGKVYWFARMLINTDKYGGIGKESKLLAKIASALRVLKSESTFAGQEELVNLQKQTIRNILFSRFSKAKTRLSRIEKFCADLEKSIENSTDMTVFIFTCESIMLPLNQAIDNIPSNDKEYTESVARAHLDVQGEAGLAAVINLWDDFGVRGCLTAERTEIVRAFGALRLAISGREDLSDMERDVVLTAFVQEFERRAAQKRKGRAGGSLEDVASFLFDYFKIKATHPPEHFQADIEVDKWIKSSDGWLIGISCKRTLRERWKQVSSADAGNLSKFKIKSLYHLITYDEDLSDDKLTLLGRQRHVFFLRDDSRKYQHASSHVGLKDYVRPMTKFIQDLKREQGLIS